ncbi:MAG TPA: CheB methylesterase domain-containing protein, partial [Polyangiaceae bacterium]|nr:CheB methylesterase domain-containing protein [Polyangiaceae bacterium]
PALFALLGALPADLPVPIFVAQHIALGFTRSLVSWLSEATKLRLAVAKDGELARAANVYLPPDGTDLEVNSEGVIKVSVNVGGCCPSGDRLLTSLASTYGSRAGAAVLTGMGEDGARGLLAVRRRGGFAVAQDERSSVVFGMPRVAQELGAASELLPVEVIAARVARRARYQPLPPGQISRGAR